jgi:hypothetical protein
MLSRLVLVVNIIIIKAIIKAVIKVFTREDKEQ